jgi:hypothetical protein
MSSLILFLTTQISFFSTEEPLTIVNDNQQKYSFTHVTFDSSITIKPSDTAGRISMQWVPLSEAITLSIITN